MLTPAQLLEPLMRHRTNEVVVTSMSVARPWGRLSDHDLDFASVDSAMGHAADLALGIALARPERKVICLNGDGSMLMSLGTLATVVDAGATNLVLFVVDNGEFVPSPVTYDGTLVGFTVVASPNASGTWNVVLSTSVGDSSWEGLPTTLEPATIMVSNAAGIPAAIDRHPFPPI